MFNYLSSLLSIPPCSIPIAFSDLGIEETLNDPVVVRGTFILGLIFLVVGLVRRDLIVRDSDIPLWVLGAILLVIVPILKFVFAPGDMFTTAVFDLSLRIFVGVISALLVHIIVRAIRGY